MEWIATAIASVVVGLLSFLGVCITNSNSNTKMSAALAQAQAVTDTKLTELTREVRAHNNFAQRIPVIEEQIKVINHRIEDLERG